MKRSTELKRSTEHLLFSSNLPKNVPLISFWRKDQRMSSSTEVERILVGTCHNELMNLFLVYPEGTPHQRRTADQRGWNLNFLLTKNGPRARLHVHGADADPRGHHAIEFAPPSALTLKTKVDLFPQKMKHVYFSS